MKTMADVSTRKKKSALHGKGGLVMLAVFVLLGIWLFFDLKKPVRDADGPPPLADYIPISSADVKRVELKRPAGGFVLVRSGDQWSFEAPKKARANSETVNTWLKGLLDDAKINRAVDAKPTDLAQYGLDKPAELVVTANGGETRTLQVGKDFRTGPTAGPGSMYYAREATSGKLFMLEASQARDVTEKNWQDLRDKRLLVLGDDKEIRRIVLHRANDTVDVQRKGDDKWQLTQPMVADADKMDVENLISQLKSTSADTLLDDQAADLAKAGLDKPRLTVQVYEKKGTSEIRFGKETRDGKVYVLRPADNQVALIPKLTYAGFDKKSADLRDRRLITLDRDKANFLEIHNASGVIKLQKQGNDWQLADDKGGKPTKAKVDTVQRLIDSATAPAYKSVQEGTANPEKYGLDKPEITVRVSNGQATSQVLQIGKKTPTGNYYAQGAPNAIFEVQPYVYTDFNVKPDAFKDTGAKK